MLHIVSTYMNARLQYVAAFIFGRVLGVDYALHHTAPEGAGSVLYYGAARHSHVPHSGLLEEQGLPKALPEVQLYEGHPVLFAHGGGEHAFGFDIFAAVFFCLSRCEEYLIKARDVHGRFQSVHSIFQPWLEQPYVDMWVRLFGKWLFAHGLAPAPQAAQARWVNTLDVDIAYAYRGRSIVRRLGAVAKDLLGGHKDRLLERRRVLADKAPDPYDTYSLWLEAGKAADAVIAFVLSASRKGYDIGLDPGHPDMHTLLRGLASKAEIGIHPSYASNEQHALLRTEMNALVAASGQALRCSRQHFLRMDLPGTYHRLQAAGMERDYSMGYADAVGFRAGTAHAFPFFDLKANEALSIELQPLIAMDSALKAYMHLTPAAALEKLLTLWSSICKSGGSMVTVWHNHSLSGHDGWEGWEQCYLDFAEAVQHTR